jgi:hypothetical protein
VAQLYCTVFPRLGTMPDKSLIYCARLITSRAICLAEDTPSFAGIHGVAGSSCHTLYPSSLSWSLQSWIGRAGQKFLGIHRQVGVILACTVSADGAPAASAEVLAVRIMPDLYRGMPVARGTSMRYYKPSSPARPLSYCTKCVHLYLRHDPAHK